MEGNVTLSTKIKTLNNFETIYQFTAEQKQVRSIILNAKCFHILRIVIFMFQAVIIGTKGTLKLPNFWTALEMVRSDGSVERFPLPSGSKHPFNFVNSANFAHEVGCHCI